MFCTNLVPTKMFLKIKKKTDLTTNNELLKYTNLLLISGKYVSNKTNKR